MAVNKNAQTRYHVLDKCFANPVKKYFIEDLLKCVNERLLEIDPDSRGIKRRQLLEDIRYMESSEGWSAPIDHIPDGKRVYYRYSDKNFSIDNQPLNQAEIEQLRDAMRLLTRFQGLPQFEWVHELGPKLEQAFLLENESAPIISFDSNSYLKGIELLAPLFHHILYKNPLCISYQSYKSDHARDFIIHPYYLKQYNNRWFLLGLNDALNKITILALDRILGISEEDIVFIPNTEYDFNEYFEDVIGVTIVEGSEPVTVVLQFPPRAAPYVLSKPLHGSQKRISNDESGLVVSLEVIPNFELESLILSFGETVKVLEPADLKERIKERLMEALKGYGASNF
ncbi:helix-turn-helix transcriptional regulator [Pararcticibacter amylolyticus]|uniref:WYL domain-containing protein n=1 Tax=Pararcticibacter amylolyticus TaxID=2173175 RepID=A0A2U2P9F4_9SPHI|nr:WYL domain-containing protein [Pararcticibacter amylolyticus]PWG78017.1 WYL domain-containing protein [Pararcticibacter amylolyticus]